MATDALALERARKHLKKARQELEFVRKYPDYCCDVCGPNGVHAYHASFTAASNALQGFLAFHGREPVNTFDVKQLAADAALAGPDLKLCLELLSQFAAIPKPGSVPDPTHRDRIVQLTEQLVTSIASRLPEDVGA